MVGGSKFKSYLWAVVILLFAVGVFIYLKATKPHQPSVAVKEKVWPVEVVPIVFKAWQPVVPLYGQVEAPQQVKVVASVAGVVAQLPVKEGQWVEKGQLLVALHKADRQLPVDKAQAQLEQAQAQLRLQQAATEANQAQLQQAQAILQLKQEAVARTKQLIRKNLASQAQLDQAKEAVVRQQQAVTQAQLGVTQQQARLDQLNAQVSSAKAALSQAQLNAERAYVVASDQLRVTKVQVAEGDFVNPHAPLLSYYRPDQLEVRASLPVSLFERVYPYWRAGGTLVGERRSDDAEGGVALQLVRFAAQAQTGTVEAFFKPVWNLTSQDVQKSAKNAKIPSPALLPGALWHFNLVLPAVKGSFAVPYTALYGMDRIYWLDKGRLKALTVQLLGDVMVEVAGKKQKWALLKPKSVEVQAASLVGAQVMVTHLPNALEGLKVQVVSEGRR